jgi:glutamate 5-kinase
MSARANAWTQWKNPPDGNREPLMPASALSHSRRIVIKIGSALLVDPEGQPNRDWLASLAEDVVTFHKQTLIVSSGAVALGRHALGLRGKLTLEQKQACAAAGQARLMRAYEEAFAPFGVAVAQALLTPDDTERRRRFLNARATLETLLALKALPIINENDTVATQEIRYGDNDRLAARVAQMVSADTLILLSDIDGLYTADPRKDASAQFIADVAAITPEIEAMAGGANAQAAVGSGGMRTKIEAAKIATDAGCGAIILHGKDNYPLQRLSQGARVTRFHAASAPRAAYKAWIAGVLSTHGEIVIDDGAARALRDGKSLLPAGVTAVRGAFEKGDAVVILNSEGQAIARGLARYDSADALRIIGLQSDQIEATLGYADGAVLVHADDLALR